MMSRKAQPSCLRYFLTLFQADAAAAGAVTVEKLVQALVHEANFAKTTALETVQNAIQDGLLKALPSSSTGGLTLLRGRLHEHKLLQLPDLEEITDASHDYYCYECHLPGTLEHCRQCVRSFHRLCYRKDPERPNYSVPSARLQKNRPPAFSSDTESDSEAGDTINDSAALDYESDVRASSSLQQVDQASLYSWPQHRFAEDVAADSTSSPLPPAITVIAVEDAAAAAQVVASTTNLTHNEDDSKMFEDFADSEWKSKVDVVCIGEVRPPTRKRPHTTPSSISYKSEYSPPVDEEETDVELCTCCRLLKHAALRNPPNLQAAELCHLVGFTFERNRTWIANDVVSWLESVKMPEPCAASVKRLLCKMPDKHLENVATKLNEQRYNFLTEFLVDILDLQHNIGVFFGPNSTEMESTKWLVRDIAYDLSEIRRCPDCFRYSHEKHSQVWFAKPCVQRHELVFAKHSGFPYWPAKVIRVLPNSKYDVRFFGGNHSRALIEARYIRPIDTDIKSLKLGNTPAIKKAMEELRYHQILSYYSPSKFSFHADKNETEHIIRSVLVSSSNVMSGRRGRPRRRSATKTANKQPDVWNALGTADKRFSICEQSELTDNAYAAQPETFYPVKRGRLNRMPEAPSRVTRSTNNYVNATDIKQIQKKLDEALKITGATKLKYDKLLQQMEKLKETIKKHEQEKKVLKRKQWCYWCLKEAIYLCCFRAAYCSQICQSRHWKDGHSKVCKNREDQRLATSTT